MAAVRSEHLREAGFRQLNNTTWVREYQNELVMRLEFTQTSVVARLGACGITFFSSPTMKRENWRGAQSNIIYQFEASLQ